MADAELFWNQYFLQPIEADEVFNCLKTETHWKQPEIRMWGRLVKSPRLSAWYADPEAFYTYSGLTNTPLPWTETLSELRDRISEACSISFNSVLLNLYRNGQDSMGWHQDNERELGHQPAIASVSLGGARRFLMKHVEKPQRRLELNLTHGSALFMAGDCQHKWKHSLPKTERQVDSRINLTFRKIK